MDIKQEVREFQWGKVVGEAAALLYESMALTADPGLRLNAHVAEPGTPSAEALALLAS